MILVNLTSKRLFYVSNSKVAECLMAVFGVLVVHAL